MMCKEDFPGDSPDDDGPNGMDVWDWHEAKGHDYNW